MSGKGTVLVSGGSGFIGSWCVIELLRQGYAVRTTLRSLGRESATRAAIGKQVDVQDRLRFYAAELTTDAGWDAAASGCDYILHVASPVAVSEPKNPDELIVPARGGTRRAISAGLKAGVKRVVLTSSVAAASPRASARERVSDETVWTDLDDPKVSAYARSKTLAERAPEAAGQRFIAASDFAWLADVAALLRARLGEAANKVPTRKVPDFVLRLAPPFHQNLAAAAPRLGDKRAFNSAKAQIMLGSLPRSLVETVLTCAR